MNKEQLLAQLAQESEVSKKVARSVLDSLVKAIKVSLKSDGKLRIDGLGTFVVVERKARTGVNPRTKAKIKIPATKAPRFRAAKALKDAVKSPAKATAKKSK